jgi:adenine-specific DNA-methyltransferase
LRDLLPRKGSTGSPAHSPLNPKDLFEDGWGTNEDANEELRGLLGAQNLLEYPKPVQLIAKLICSVRDEKAIVCDLFSGSCTTAHAVYAMNKLDGGSRKFIMVQLPELCDKMSEAYKAGYKTIADIGKERIRRVITKLNEEDSGKLALDNIKKQDRGFRVYKLARSNFKVWDSEQAAQAPEAFAKQLELHELHIDPHAAHEDILYELLLKAGFPLTTKVKTAQMAGKEVFSIADGGLLICLEREITKELIKAMADADPLQVICLDEGFKANDQLKANAVQTFKARNQSKDKEAGIVFRTV